MKKIVPSDATLIPAEASRVFKGEIFDVYQWPQTLFDGSEATFESIRRPDTVLCIGITTDKHLLVVEDGQPHIGTKLSFPGGRVDKTDASTLAAAQRETKEETGYTFQNWRLIQVVQPHAKLEWFTYLYVAEQGEKTAEPHPDAGEKIVLKKLSFAEVKELSLTSAGYLGEVKDLLEPLQTTEELLALPEYVGTQVDR